MSAFAEMRLGDVIKLQRGFDITKAEQNEGSVPIVSSSGISSYHDKAKVKGPGVVIGRKGTLGTVHYLRDDFWPHDTTLWVKDFKGNDSRFVSYFLRTMRLENFDVGASNPTVNRNHLHKVRIVFPKSPKTQRRIAAVLSAYDELIENSKRRIALLEKLADEIYREWFVRFRFPGYQKTKIVKGVPEGWDFLPLTSLADITYGFAFDGARFNSSGVGKPIIRIRNVSDSNVSDFTDEHAKDKYLVGPGDLVVGMDGEFHINRWYGPEAYLVQRVCKIKAKQAELEGYLSHAIRPPIKHFESILMGATVGHLGAVHLKSIRLLVPPKGLWPQLKVFDRLQSQRMVLEQAVRKLASTRDLLIPRLLSGKLAVGDLDIRFPPGMAEDLVESPR